ncbi:MAG: hypothetical protein ACT6FF_00355 [Methanosarcinaceae archaeon]
MKSTILILTTLILTCLVAPGQAKIWIVDNTGGNPLADTTSLQHAHDIAPAGDTLYVYGSETSYGTLTLSKKLFIFGTGYFLDENPNTKAKLAESKTGSITFNTGSEGSVLSGFEVSGYVRIYADNIVLKRNYIHTGNSNVIYVNSSAGNALITQNFLEYTGTNNYRTIIFDGKESGIISNNYIFHTNTSTHAINFSTDASAKVQNNVIYGKVTVRNGEFRNNILRSGSFTSYNCPVTNNICDADQFPDANGNKPNTSMTSVFVDSAGNSTDGRWQIATGSIAQTAGVNGTECGMFSTFSGNTPYVLSGLPPIPTIYYFEAPLRGAQNQGLDVTIKVRAIH